MRILKIAQVPSQVDENIEDPSTYQILKDIFDKHDIEWQKATKTWTKGTLGKKTESPITRYSLNLLGFRKDKTTSIGTKIYNCRALISIDSSLDIKNDLYVELFLNKSRTTSIQGNTVVALWSIRNDLNAANTLQDILESKLGVARGFVKFPIEEEKEVAQFPEHVRLTRMKNRLSPATSLDIYVKPKRLSGSIINFVVTNIETGEKGKEKNLADKVVEEVKDSSGATKSEMRELKPSDIGKIIAETIQRAQANGYVDESSPLYIPDGANENNYDFILNEWREKEPEEFEEQEKSKVVEKPQKTVEREKKEEEEEFKIDYEKFLSSPKGYMKLSQGYSGYFVGDIPEYAVDILGTGSVDASQIKGMFNKVDDAIRLVNKFDHSLLENISFIFNFARSGAYGVYLSALDRVIKTKALKKKLEGQGYKVKMDNNNLLTAYPTKEQKTTEQIQADIDKLYQDLESKGGTAFGINMNAVLDAARQDATSSQSQDPDIWQWMALIHLGATIVHEAIHAKGYSSEGPSEASAQSFIGFALPLVNNEYQKSLASQGKEEMYAPLIIGNTVRHASGNAWYKTAQQLSYYVPPFLWDYPIGSDLSGRFPSGPQSRMGLAPWAMMAQRSQTEPIEKRLSRQYMSPLPPDLSQENDIIEEQLRKYTREDEKADPNSTMEELLADDYDEPRGYKTLEGLLDEKRPKPLIVPIVKEASLKKVATLFGWMNNLAISDGSTIPGLSDRVMAWEDRDEDFSHEEGWIRKQRRYNPTYDIKGFYYRWIEPRFHPQLFDDMNRDYVGVHPAKRFASNIDIDSNLAKVLSILSIVKSKILNKEIPSTRLLMTEDVLPLVNKLFKGIETSIFYCGETENKENICAVWVFNSDASANDIENAEKNLQKGTIDGSEELMEKLLGYSNLRNSVVKEVVEDLKNISMEYEFENIFDGCVKFYPADNIVFNINNFGKDKCLKITSLLSNKLGAGDISVDSRNNIGWFVYKGFTIILK